MWNNIWSVILDENKLSRKIKWLMTIMTKSCLEETRKKSFLEDNQEKKSKVWNQCLPRSESKEKTMNLGNKEGLGMN